MRERGGESRERSKGIQRGGKKKENNTERRAANPGSQIGHTEPHQGTRETRVTREPRDERDEGQTPRRDRRARTYDATNVTCTAVAANGRERRRRGPKSVSGPRLSDDCRIAPILRRYFTRPPVTKRSFESTSARNGGTRLNKCREFLIRPYRDFSLVHSYVIIYAI